MYILFLARGLDLLEAGGKLGMITQVSYVSQKFAKGIQNHIKDEGTVRYFVDLKNYGPLIFPGYTNYPAISIIEKTNSKDSVEVVEVQ